MEGGFGEALRFFSGIVLRILRGVVDRALVCPRVLPVQASHNWGSSISTSLSRDRRCDGFPQG
eukprot:1525337-Pyramimonas_sp.AAC.1